MDHPGEDKVEAMKEALEQRLLKIESLLVNLTANDNDFVKLLEDNREFHTYLQSHARRDGVILKTISNVQLKLDHMGIRLRKDAQPLPFIPTVQGKPVGITPAETPAELIAAQQEVARLNEELAKTFTIRSEHELAQKTIAKLEARLEEEKKGRDAYLARFHGLAQELADHKGNVRIMCRLKPESAPEDQQIVFSNLDGEQSFLPWSRLGVVTKEDDLRPETRDFKFERVFGPGDDNATIFEEVKDFALSATMGRSATIMGYGATGSGKTHTFLAEDGLVPSYLRFLFAVAAEECTARLYFFKLSAVEIYLNKITDLLSKEALNFGASASSHPVDTLDGALELLGKAAGMRQVAGTALNKTSSRSHFVLTVTISRRRIEPGSREKTTEGVINFVDLAGSEPVGKLQKNDVGAPTKEQEKIAAEGQDINNSLLDLGKAVRSLSRKQTFIGSHSLTKFLRPSLSVESRVLVLVTVSSLLVNRGNTVSTLLWSQESAAAYDSPSPSRRAAPSTGARGGRGPTSSTGSPAQRGAAQGARSSGGSSAASGTTPSPSQRSSGTATANRSLPLRR
ncbi:P-loop containing nucleoside triphosphate hydrolase protein [Xylariaceae sp. FL0594]|nr:P-loop containing nucleoside triphosphate hydrolase protein [Xylariaceae sp. FL0594]